jgi:hypothetical protein
MKITKVYEDPNGNLVRLYGGRKCQLRLAKPEWSKEEEECFIHFGRRYFLSEFMRTDRKGVFGLDVDGVASDSYFSGVLIKVDPEGEYVTAWTYST